jgi:hypothetical protein
MESISEVYTRRFVLTKLYDATHVHEVGACLIAQFMNPAADMADVQAV